MQVSGKDICGLNSGMVILLSGWPALVNKSYLRNGEKLLYISGKHRIFLAFLTFANDKKIT